MRIKYLFFIMLFSLYAHTQEQNLNNPVIITNQAPTQTLYQKQEQKNEVKKNYEKPNNIFFLSLGLFSTSVDISYQNELLLKGKKAQAIKLD